MKITVDNISEMFEGTKELLIGGLITAITGAIIIVNVSEVVSAKIPLMIIAIFLFTVVPGFFAMLFSPLTKITAKLFDIKSSTAICRVLSGIYFILYWYVPLIIVNMIITSIMYMGSGDGGLRACFAIGCFIIAVVQTRKFFRLLTA
ncbi:hypothetical protein [Kluyvera ascorbata]|uniref:hypothetical protein n=1 Tax=Kluyvera ascorbata TaxID=51288 RepID=UPI0004E2FF4B|nr:hypothetical protein [Kluyvera ascorbata]EJG2388854.1 hypothetical protein [Kluyvera ascorbata]KFC88669.1 hypothetical protein GKAS_04604 [Kluyvera ascorbata ATCC 33433]MDU1198432.1 hypothetical protein [Kluyvera ascorbata]BCA40327.1 hypothetical protein KATP_28490 [Kluyvera ascorbata]HBL0734187.1 hypothetical protein [Kluyvera ascorbata]